MKRKAKMIVGLGWVLKIIKGMDESKSVIGLITLIESFLVLQIQMLLILKRQNKLMKKVFCYIPAIIHHAAIPSTCLLEHTLTTWRIKSQKTDKNVFQQIQAQGAN